MTTFTALTVLLILAVATDAFITTAVIYHLRKYTLPSWTVANTVTSLYLLLSLLLIGAALYWLFRIPAVTPAFL